MADQSWPVFDILVGKRGRRWWWSVWTAEGVLLMSGFATNRLAARYEAHKALFLLLLSAPYHSRSSIRAIQREIRARGSPEL